MLDARDHLLTDEAALVEVDSGELIHVGLVGKRVAVRKVGTALRHAERDPMRLVVGRLDQRGADRGRRLGGEVGRQHAAHAERGQPRVGVGEAVRRRAGGAVPDRHHAQRLGQVLVHHLGAQLVEVEPLHQRRRERARTIEE